MIKGIFELQNDISARAGQFLVIREDNSIHAVSREALESVFMSKAASVEVPAAAEPTKAKRVSKKDKAFGYYKTAEALERARARGRYVAEIRARKREADRLAREGAAA